MRIRTRSSSNEIKSTRSILFRCFGSMVRSDVVVTLKSHKATKWKDRPQRPALLVQNISYNRPITVVVDRFKDLSSSSPSSRTNSERPYHIPVSESMHELKSAQTPLSSTFPSHTCQSRTLKECETRQTLVGEHDIVVDCCCALLILQTTRHGC